MTINTGTTSGSVISQGMTIAVPAGKDEYDLYTCHSCGRLITPEEEKRAMSTGVVCPCGSNRYRPTKIINAEPNEAGDYVVTGRYGETHIIPKAVFEAIYEAVQK